MLWVIYKIKGFAMLRAVKNIVFMISCFQIVHPSTINLVIINSSEEIFIEDKSNRNIPMVQNCVMALAEQELVLCHKHTWIEVLRMVDYAKNQPWFARWNNFEEQIFSLTGSIQEGVSRLISQNKDFLYTDGCFESKCVVSFYACFQIFKACAYEYKEIGDYILFVPSALAQKGFRLSSLPLFDINKEHTIKELYVRYGSRDKSANNLYRAVAQIAQDESVKDYDFTIYLIGHGNLGEMVAEMSIQEPEKQSYLSKFLAVLEKSYRVNSLTIVSCYGGANQQKVASYIKRPFVDDLSFPILLSGIDETFAMSSLTITADDFESSQHWDSLYLVTSGKYLYGPSKIIGGKGFFELFFEYMNHSTTYKVSQRSYKKTLGKSSPSYEYEAKTPEYIKAVYLLRGGLDKENPNNFFGIHRPSSPFTMFFIRYPHTSIWVPVENPQNKSVFIVNKTKIAVNDKEIVVPKEAEKVYLATPFIPAPLNLMKAMPGCIVLPIIFEDLFFIKKLMLPKSRSFEQLGNIFYMRPSEKRSNREIFIEELIAGDNKVYKNVLLVHEFEDSPFYQGEKYRHAMYEDDGIMKIYDFMTKKHSEVSDRHLLANYKRAKSSSLGKAFQDGHLIDYSQVETSVRSLSGNVGQVKNVQDFRKQKAEREVKALLLDALELASLLK